MKMNSSFAANGKPDRTTRTICAIIVTVGTSVSTCVSMARYRAVKVMKTIASVKFSSLGMASDRCDSSLSAVRRVVWDR